MTSLKLSLLLAPLVLADVGFRNGNTTLGPVRDLDCARDGGLLCSRDSGTQIGQVRCTGATATETGCVTPSAQTFGGTKTLSGDMRLIGHAHGSLTACSSGVKGMWQTCTTHNAPVFCDGTNNIETLGPSSGEQTLYSIGVNGIPTPIFASFTISATSAATITAISGGWGLGSGSGSLPLAFLHSGGTCLCTVDCDVPATRTPCTGNCSVVTDGGVFGIRGTSTCTLDPYVGNDLEVKGTRP